MSGELKIITFDENLKKDILSSDVQTVWEAYKRLHGLQEMSVEQERDILTILVANNLNPLKKEVFLIRFKKWNKETKKEEFDYTPVVAYQTLMKRAYEEGYDSKDISFKEKRIQSVEVSEKEGKTLFKDKEDLEVTATITTSEGKSYSFSALWSQYAQYIEKKEGRVLTKMWKEKGVLMLRKCALAGLFRTLPKTNLQGMPYTPEEMPEEMKVVDPVIANPSKIPNTEFQAKLKEFKNRVDSLMLKGSLKAEQGLYWTHNFEICESVECLMEKGRELASILNTDKTQVEYECDEETLEEASKVFDNALNLDLPETQTTMGYGNENG